MNHSCLVCHEVAVELLLDLGSQPISNRFPRRPEEDNERHRFQFGCCPRCGLAQLVDPPPPDLVRPRVDWIRYNEPEAHLDDFAERLTKLPGIGAESKFLGLTYKEDSTLERLTARAYSNCHRLDLAIDWRISDPCAGLETVQGCLNPGWVSQSERNHQADVVIARHVVEHAQSLRDVVAGLVDLVRPGGYLAIEVPDNTRIFAHRDVCFLWEEHVAYFTPATLEATLRQMGLDVAWLHSYSYAVENALVCIARIPDTRGRIADAVSAADSYSQAADFVASFPADAQRVREKLTTFRREVGPIAVFGAGHLACKFINFNSVAAEITFVVDDHPHKQQCLMPGSRLPILPGSQLAESGVRLVLLSVNPDSESRIIEKYAPTCGDSVQFASLFRASPRSFDVG